MTSVTAARKVSLAFQTDKPLAAYGPLARMVEDYGFDGVTVYNDMLYQPAWLPLLEIAKATQEVQIGVAAVNPFTCHPINIAGNFALIDEAAHGRAYLGLARGGWLDFVGIEPRRPVTALREAFECVRHLLRQSNAPYQGEVFSLAGGDTLRWALPRADAPFLLGAWGEATIRACSAEVSELKIGGTANPDIVPHYRRILNAATAKEERTREIGLVVGAVCVVDRDGAVARQQARREVALYLPIVAELDPTLVIDPMLLARIRSAAAQYDYTAIASLIPDDLLQRFAFAGAPDDVAAQAQALFAAGASRIEFGTPHGRTPVEGIRLLGEAVLPQLRNRSG